MKTHMSLKDVARLLKVKPYRVTYALTTGLVPEPTLRISNKRIFQAEDVRRLAKHFGVELKEKK
jgi:DNA-binding transcriptional MerR regulator